MLGFRLGDIMNHASRIACILLLIGAGATVAGQAAICDGPEGVLPVGADGKPLNLDFETGTLKDWTATGDAFNGQPVRGDTVNARRPDMKSNHAGQWWVGTYEVQKNDRAQGTLTSVTFPVTQP